jgi:hypothetical protein
VAQHPPAVQLSQQGTAAAHGGVEMTNAIVTTKGGGCEHQHPRGKRGMTTNSAVKTAV